MSVALMSSVFKAQIQDLTYESMDMRHTVKASTAKLVLLALSDHANDYGESSYPSLTTLEHKTCLSRRGLLDTLYGLEACGYITYVSGGSRLGTNLYQIDVAKLDGEATSPAVVKPLHQDGEATSPEPSVTIPEPSLRTPPLDWQIAAGNTKLTMPVKSEIQDEAYFLAGQSLHGAEDCIPYAITFMVKTGIMISKASAPRWKKEIRQQIIEPGFNLGDFEQAIDDHKSKLGKDHMPLSIKSPGSVTYGLAKRAPIPTYVAVT